MLSIFVAPISRGGIVKDFQTQSMHESSAVTYESNAIRSGTIDAPCYYSSDEPPIESWRYEYVKRGMDILCAATMLLVFAIPGLLIAAAILLDSEGGVFYREERIGCGGRPFRIWKFRSMYRHASQVKHIATEPSGWIPMQWRTSKHKHLTDPRITSVGCFLRQWSLDEFPQLLNVLHGEMSLIGPRPIVQAETVLYGNLLGFYLDAKPGLSGLWQVSGRSNVSYDRRAKLDASYVRSWSLRGDMAILLKTIPAVLKRDGAR
jgi:exopolysaccharide production protein ExoY